MMPTIRNLLLGSTSPALLPETKAAADEQGVASRSKGRRGKPNSRLISYRREGPFYTQTGTFKLAGEEMPRIRRSYVHKFLHATKGWRSYNSGKLFHLTSATVGRGGFQLLKRSTWRPNAKEQRLGLVPRMSDVVVQMFQYIGRNGIKVGFKPVATHTQVV